MRKATSMRASAAMKNASALIPEHAAAMKKLPTRKPAMTLAMVDARLDDLHRLQDAAIKDLRAFDNLFLKVEIGIWEERRERLLDARMRRRYGRS